MRKILAQLNILSDNSFHSYLQLSVYLQNSIEDCKKKEEEEEEEEGQARIQPKI